MCNFYVYALRDDRFVISDFTQLELNLFKGSTISTLNEN